MRMRFERFLLQADSDDTPLHRLRRRQLSCSSAPLPTQVAPSSGIDRLSRARQAICRRQIGQLINNLQQAAASRHHAHRHIERREEDGEAGRRLWCSRLTHGDKQATDTRLNNHVRTGSAQGAIFCRRAS